MNPVSSRLTRLLSFPARARPQAERGAEPGDASFLFRLIAGATSAAAPPEVWGHRDRWRRDRSAWGNGRVTCWMRVSSRARGRRLGLFGASRSKLLAEGCVNRALSPHARARRRRFQRAVTPTDLHRPAGRRCGCWPTSTFLFSVVVHRFGGGRWSSSDRRRC
jgi:hypothetical protein